MGCQDLNGSWHLQSFSNVLPICIMGLKYYESSPVPISKINYWEAVTRKSIFEAREPAARSTMHLCWHEDPVI